MPAFIRIVATVFIAALTSPALAIGFHYVSIPDDTGRLIEIGIWYPSNSVATAISVGHLPQNAALDGEIVGKNLPIVVFSHGSAGWFGDRADTAQLFAQAGVVAVSLTYPGDNHKDSSDKALQQMTSRPLVTSKVLDYALETWSGRDHLDKNRIGFYGFSAGGFTGLVEIGGVPSWTLFAEHCKADPNEGVCKEGAASFLASPKAAALPTSIWHHDGRIKAAALASPGFAFAFDPGSLRDIKIPIELWGGEKDAVVPYESNVAYLSRSLPNLVGVREVMGAQHYSFLQPCSDASKAKNSEICSDLPNFDRAAFQEKFNEDLLRFFQSHLVNRTL